MYCSAGQCLATVGDCSVLPCPVLYCTMHRLLIFILFCMKASKVSEHIHEYNKNDWRSSALRFIGKTSLLYPASISINININLGDDQCTF